MNIEKLLQLIKSLGAIGIAVITLYMFYMLATDTIQRNTEAYQKNTESTAVFTEVSRASIEQSKSLESSVRELSRSLYLNNPTALR